MPSSKPRFAPPFWRWFAVVFVMLAALRALMPFVVTEIVRDEIRGSGFELTIDDLDLNLWRGAYELEGVRLDKVSHFERPEPFLQADRIDFSLHWGALLRGRIVNSTSLHRPRLSIVEDPDGPGQTGEDVSWGETLQNLVPLRIDRFVVRDGAIHYEKHLEDDVVDLYATDVYFELLHLSNSDDPAENRPATVELAARPFGTGELEATLQFDLRGEDPDLLFKGELRSLQFAALNDYLQAYAAVDVEQGTLGVYTELELEGGRWQGYVKTLVEDLQVLSWGEIGDPGDALEAAWEGLVGSAAEVLENQPHDRLAVRADVQGQAPGGVEIGTWGLIVSLLENAFLQALSPTLDNTFGGDVAEGGS